MDLCYPQFKLNYVMLAVDVNEQQFDEKTSSKFPLSDFQIIQCRQSTHTQGNGKLGFSLDFCTNGSNSTYNVFIGALKPKRFPR